jgi:hypothetical protein
MEAPLRLRLVVLLALWLAVVGVISAQEGEPWHGNKTRGQGITVDQRTRDEPLGKHQRDPDRLPTVYPI